MGPIQSIDDFIGLLVRRRLLIGAVTVFGMVITLLYVMGKPDIFESTAVIQVQAPTVAGLDDASRNSRESSAQRLQALQQQLTTRENMLGVIERHGLFAGAALTDDQKIHLLRISLNFQTVASAASTGFGSPAEVSAMLISAQAATRSQAARVANDFAQSILDAGAATELERAREAARFYRGEETALRKQIADLEAKIATYQSENRDALPAQRDLLRAELTGLETELRSLDQSLVRARNERAAIERKPQQRATDRRQIDDLAALIDSLSAQSEALTTRRNAILLALTQSPEIDRTLSEYERELSQLQSQFDVITRRAAEAATTEKLQDRQQGEIFTLLERAVEPDYPITGGRKKLAGAGAMASLMLGIIAAFLMDLAKPTLRTTAQLERELDLRAIVAIPEVRKTRRSLRRALTPGSGAISELPKGKG